MNVDEIYLKLTQYLTEKFDSQFEANKEHRNAARHFYLTSNEIDFSFPITFVEEASMQSLLKKVDRWLANNLNNIEENNHYVFDASGVMRSGS
ncbi:MAG: hypothetical protein ACJAS1_005037 [Oleiphilaceae bacterium]|jgi:hypothetical protein